MSSDYVKFEIEQIEEPSKRKNVRGFERILSKINVTSSRRLIDLAKGIDAKCEINSLDALHLAAACLGNARFFLTCDDEVLDSKDCVEAFVAEEEYKLKVRNPIVYVKEV